MNSSILLMGRLILLTLLCAAISPCASAEAVVFKNGFRMSVERHETEGDSVRLYLSGGGFAVMSTAEIERFEAEEPRPQPQPEPGPAPVQAVEAKTAPPQQSVEESIRAAGAKYGLDPDFIRSIIAAESAGDPKAVSPKGAVGLMQLMPGTAKTLGVANVFDPSSNVDGGTAYIRQLLDRYGDVALALAAYNAGPQKVDSHGGLPPYRETIAYVTRVITKFNQEKSK